MRYIFNLLCDIMVSAHIKGIIRLSWFITNMCTIIYGFTVTYNSIGPLIAKPVYYPGHECALRTTFVISPSI